jgi:hypothetical protein
MIVKRTLIAAAAGALMTGPAWALPALAPADPGNGHGPPTTTPPRGGENQGISHRSTEGTEHSGGAGHGPPAGSHKCTPHRVGYVASGTLVNQTLAENADGTYSGELTVEVKHANHHAKSDTSTTKTYKVEKVHVSFGLADTNSDGSVGLDDLKAGDRVRLIGKITALAKQCDHKEFTATTTIRKVVFNAP